MNANLIDPTFCKNATVYLRGRTNPVARTVYTDGSRFWIGASENPVAGENATFVTKKFQNAGTKMRTMYFVAK
jgi:hypothetical protein